MLEVPTQKPEAAFFVFDPGIPLFSQCQKILVFSMSNRRRNTVDEIDRIVQEAYAYLNNNEVVIRTPDGVKHTFKGGFSHGISEQRPGESIKDTFSRADAEMYRDKSQRKLSRQKRQEHGGRPEGEKDSEGVDRPTEVTPLPGDILAPKSGRPFTTKAAAQYHWLRTIVHINMDTNNWHKTSDGNI